MRHHHYLFLLLTLLALTSCRTPQAVQRHHPTPDATLTSLTPSQDISSGTEVHREVMTADVITPAGTLAKQLTTLLQTNDSLLNHSQLGLHILDLTTGDVIYAHNASQRMRPASTEKVVTAIAALDILGPQHILATQLFSTADINGSTLSGDIYIKGVMDPLLTASDVRSLAKQVRDLGVTRITGRLIADASFKDNDEYGWGWCWDDDNPTLSPLLCDGKPKLVEQLMSAFRSQGISVQRGTSTGTTPATARPLATVMRPLTAILQPMMKESDNLCAEAVFYQLGRSRQLVSQAITDVLCRAACADGQTIADGSGLSLYNYQTPETFTRLLTYAATRPDAILTPLLNALPIAATDGTLKRRMSSTPAAANVRAKTGSVNAISTLVGYTTQRSTGHLIAFAIMNQGVRRMAEGRQLQDQICSLLSQ